MTTLFDPIRFGDIAAANRIVMAPLTRDRAGPGRTPTSMMVTYYEQRASAGLIVSEGTQITAAAFACRPSRRPTTPRSTAIRRRCSTSSSSNWRR